MDRKRIAGEGWLGPYNPDGTLTVEEAHRHQLKEGEVELQFRLWLDRRVQAEYSRVALRQMYRLAKNAGVPFNKLNPALEEYALPDELQSIAARITQYINEDQPLQLSAQEEALLPSVISTTQPITSLPGHSSHSNLHLVACGAYIGIRGSNDQKVCNTFYRVLRKFPSRWVLLACSHS